MSSLAPAPEATGARVPSSAPHGSWRSARRDAALSVAVAGGLALLAFTTRSGGGLAPDTADVWSQIVLVLLAAAAGVVGVLLARGGRAGGDGRAGRAGRAGLAAFAALAALSYASIAWGVQPALAWFEADRTLSYFAAFALGIVLARVAPSRWPALAGGLALYAVAVCGWALLARVFPDVLDASDALGRLGVPFGYYNATGLVAAMGLPVWLWLGTRERRRAEGGSSLEVATVPALALLVTTLLLSYGRGALAAAAVGLGLWFALVARRLGPAVVLAVGVIGGAAIGVWATAQRAISHDYVLLPQRTAAGHRFGVVLVVALLLLTAVGVALARLRTRVEVPDAVRRWIVIALRVAAALVPVLIIVALAASSRGLTGEVSHLWSSLTNPHSTVPDAPGRLGELASSRPRYWGDGLDVGSHAPFAGVGAGGFAVAVRRYASDRVTHAHSYIVQTFADLGALGLLISAALLLACVRGWRDAVRSALRDAGGEARAGIAALLAVAVIFGIHSAIDWTWFVPGCAVPAILCAGWLVAWRGGPVGAQTGRGDPVRTAPAAPVRVRLRSAAADPVRAGAALALVAVALLAVWFVWQPLRSANAQSAAENALLRGAAGQALTDARTAASALPVDARPHELTASILEALHQPAAARAELLEATRLQPSNPDPWYALGEFDAAHRLPSAAAELARAHKLDPFGTAG